MAEQHEKPVVASEVLTLRERECRVGKMQEALQILWDLSGSLRDLQSHLGREPDDLQRAKLRKLEDQEMAILQSLGMPVQREDLENRETLTQILSQVVDSLHEAMKHEISNAFETHPENTRILLVVEEFCDRAYKASDTDLKPLLEFTRRMAFSPEVVNRSVRETTGQMMDGIFGKKAA